MRGSHVSTCSTSHFKGQIKYDPEELSNVLWGKCSYSLLNSAIIYLCLLVPTRYLLSACYMPSTIPREEIVNKTKKILKSVPLWSLYSVCGETNNIVCETVVLWRKLKHGREIQHANGLPVAILKRVVVEGQSYISAGIEVNFEL